MNKPQKYYSTDQVIEILNGFKYKCSDKFIRINVLVDATVEALEKQRPKPEPPTLFEKLKLKFNKTKK
jgi:hypothetical protein